MPSSAVTTTVSVLSPIFRSALPLITTFAEESLGIAVTATASVPAGRIMFVPSTTLTPETLNEARLLIDEGTSTFNVTV